MTSIRFTAVWLTVSAVFLGGCAEVIPPPRTGYVPAEEEGVMTSGLDDHDYDLAAAGIAREMLERGLPKGYVVALGPVDTKECPFDVRMRQLQKSLQVVLSKEGSMKFFAAIDAMAGNTAAGEIYKIMEYNWSNRNPLDVKDLQTFGRLAKVNGILFGRVSAMQRRLPRGGFEVTYRFVWELANTETGVVDISHEEKIRKNIR